MKKKDFDKIQENAIKAKVEMDKSELDYRSAIDKFNKFQDSFDYKWAEMSETIQRTENERSRLILDSFRQTNLLQMEFYGLFSQASRGKVKHIPKEPVQKYSKVKGPTIFFLSYFT